MSKTEVRWNGEIFHRLREAQAATEKWRINYNNKRPHSSIGHKPSARLTIACKLNPSNKAQT